jgi:hypothetical protein
MKGTAYLIRKRQAEGKIPHGAAPFDGLSRQRNEAAREFIMSFSAFNKAGDALRGLGPSIGAADVR